MIHNAYSVLDTKGQVYSTPWYSQNHATAIRAFLDVADQPNSAIGTHPEDYLLFFIGTFDDIICEFKQAPQFSLGTVLSYRQTPTPPSVNTDKPAIALETR